MKRYLLLILAAMLFSISGAFAQIDTVWVSNRDCSTENITVSPDERFVVAWGWDGWFNDGLDPYGSWNLYGDPAKVFNAQTGEWLTTIYDSVVHSYKNSVSNVSFSPDSSKMLVSFEFGVGTLIIDLNNNFNVIDTIHYGGYAIYSPDMSLIVTSQRYLLNFFNADTYEIVAEFDWKAKIEHGEISPPTYIDTDVLPGIFRKNGREYVFPYIWNTSTMPFPSHGHGLCVIDLVDSTCTLNPDVPYQPFYYRNNTNYYSAVEKIEGNTWTFTIRNQETDELIWEKAAAIKKLPSITSDGEHFVFWGKYYNFTDTNSICENPEGLKGPSELGNEYYYSNGGYRILATRPCTYLGVPPPITKQEIKTYPVPTNNTLNIELELKGGDYKAEIVDINGRTIRTHNLGFKQGGNEILELDTSDLPSGTYMMIIRSESDSKTVKFIKN